MAKIKTWATWILQIIVAVILIQTLRFKFTAAPESVYIFGKLGIEPWGRILTGVLELIAGVFLLIPRTVIYGAIATIGIIGGAILSHLTLLGIVVQGDGGKLFGLGVFTLVCACIVVYLRKEEWKSIPFLKKFM